jgi:hypothetical protein
MAVSVSRKTLYWTAAGVVVAAIALVVTVAWTHGTDAGGGHSQTQSGTGNMQAGDGGLVVGGDLSVQSEQFKAEVRGLTREQAEQAGRKYANVAPPRGQAAPFLVIDAPHHLWVRSSGTAGGHHIGAAFDGATVWADCQVTTDFDPDRTDGTGAVWLRIHWPTDQPNDQLNNSQPADPYAGWVYAGQTLPAGHNGKIATCDNP